MRLASLRDGFLLQRRQVPLFSVELSSCRLEHLIVRIAGWIRVRGSVGMSG